MPLSAKEELARVQQASKKSKTPAQGGQTQSPTASGNYKLPKNPSPGGQQFQSGEGYSMFGVPQKNVDAMRKELEAKRAAGVIFRDAPNQGPGTLQKRGYVQDRWQPGQNGTPWLGLEMEPEEPFPKELPKGAIGWDDDGNPTWGGRTPFQEWQLRAHANLERETQITPYEASWDDWNAPKIADQEGFVNKAKALLAGGIEAYDQISQSVDYALSGGDSEVNDLQNAWRQVSHYGAETLQRLGAGAYQTKLFFGGVAHVIEEEFGLGTAKTDANVHFTERYKRLQAESDQFTVAPKHDTKFWRNLGVSQKFIDEYTHGALAGRMFYSTIWDNSVDSIRNITGTGKAGNMKKEEFLRYMAENPQANPNDVVKKYENPAAEMWGEIIFDPLNVVEWGAKSVTAVVMIGRATKYFANPLSEVGKVLQKGGLNRVSGLLDDAADIAKIDTLVKARMLDVAAIKDKITDLAKSKRMWGLTNSAKAHVAAQDMTAVQQWAWRASKMADGTYSIDDFMEIQRLIGLSAGSESEILEAMQGLSRFSGYDIVFTEPGTRSALMMQDMFKPGHVKKLREALASHPDDYIKGLRKATDYADELIEKQTKKFFPDMHDEAYKAGSGWKLLAKTHRYMQDGPYKLFNKFFSSIYMGLNPGFAARNVMQNTLQGLLDEGIGGVFGLNTVDNITRWAGGTPPPGFVTEFGSITKGEEVTLKSKLFIGTNWAGKGERIAGEKIFGKIYPKTMKKLLNNGLGWKELQKYGISRTEAKTILAATIDNAGDVDKAIDMLVDAHKTGILELRKTSLGWTDEMVKWADDLGMHDDIMDIMTNSSTQEDAILGIRREFQKLWDEGENVVDDYPTIEVGALGAEEVHAHAEAIDLHGDSIMKNEHFFITTYHGMNNRAFNVANEMGTQYKTQVAYELIKDGHFSDINQADAFLMDALRGVNLEGTDIPLADYLKGAGGRQYSFIEAEHGALTAAIGEDSRKVIKKGADLEAYWNKWGVPEFAGPYRGQNAYEVRTQMWIGQRKKSRPMFEAFREESAMANKQAAEIWKVTAEAKTGRAIAPVETQEMGKLLDVARRYDSFLDRRDIGVQLGAAIDSGDAERIAVQFARMFNISTASKAGVPSDQKLVNIINKQLGKRFSSLKDMQGRITGPDIEKALLAHATGEIIGVYQTAGEAGWTALRKLVSTNNVTPEELADINRTVDVIRQADRQLADELQSAIANRAGKLADKKRRGRRMTVATTQQIDEEIGVLQQKIDELIDEGQQVLGEVDIDQEVQRTLAEQMVDQRLADVRKAAKGKLPEAQMAYYSGEGPPSRARQALEMRPRLREMEEEFVDMARNVWGKTETLVRDKDAIKRLERVRKYGRNVVEESRQIAGKVALNKRNFILHDYAKKRNFDLALSYVMPYHFWYNRTYAAWLQRTVTHPGTITAYLDYKDMLAKIHADAPDWWKNNLNSNELLGIDSDDPWYFNLEQTLNPLNGLTGLDFDDRDKAFNWFSSLMQDVGKFGPSVYTPIAWAIAADAWRQGEEVAASKWAGRVFPQSQTLKALTAKFGYGPGGSGLELDPAVWLTSGGVDVWESRRIGRALGWAVDQGILTEEQAQQAAMEGAGNPDFDNARGAAQSKRSNGQLTSFLFGTGFKGRTAEDMQIDKMDEEYARFLAVKDTLSPEQITESYEYFKSKYPFFNTLMIARRDVDGRDTSYAYSVLSRIPPGQTKEAYNAMGLSREQVQEFWDNKGIPETWSEKERLDFNHAIQTVGTMLAMPKDATKQEWDEARKRSKALYEVADTIFPGGRDATDEFFRLYGEDPDAAKEYKRTHPIVGEYQNYLNWGNQNDEILRKYYASFDTLRQMTSSEVWATLNDEFGDRYSRANEQYQELRLSDPKAARKFYKANPVIKEYRARREELQAMAAERLIAQGSLLPDVTPGPVFREDVPAFEQQTPEQQAVYQGFEQEEVPEHYRWNFSQWQGILSPALGRLVQDWIVGGEELSYTAEQSLEYQLKDLGIEDTEEAKRLIRHSYFGTHGNPERGPYAGQ